MPKALLNDVGISNYSFEFWVFNECYFFILSCLELNSFYGFELNLIAIGSIE